MILALLVFDRSGTCLLQRFFQDYKLGPHETQLLFGMLWQAERFAQTQSPARLEALEHEQVLGYSTDQYRVFLLRTLTGVRFVLVTDPESSDRSGTLREIYARYAQLVLRQLPLDSLADAL